MTFAEGLLRLVRLGARIDRLPDPGAVAPGVAEAAAAEPAVEPADDLAVELLAEDGLPADAAEAAMEPSPFEPGFADLEAAVALVEAGLATRVVLSGFPSWPGLLWQAYQLAEAANVLILPTVVRPGGRVDIVVTRDTAADG
jgi:hypothetical protein